MLIRATEKTTADVDRLMWWSVGPSNPAHALATPSEPQGLAS